MQSTCRRTPRLRLVLGLLAPLLVCAGCATTGEDPTDPWEKMNRGIYSFNKSLDRAVIKPIAQGYQAIMPDLLDRAVTNFFGNLTDVTTAANNVLQLKITDAFEDLGRVAVNTTIGLGGLIDIASGVGMPKHDEDFGQTLGRWGVAHGPYFVIPVLGPSSVRDGVGLAVDTIVFNPLFFNEDLAVSFGLVGIKTIDARADLLSAERVLEQAALDEYSFVRDAYFQRRRNLVYDGNPPDDGG